MLKSSRTNPLLSEISPNTRCSSLPSWSKVLIHRARKDWLIRCMSKVPSPRVRPREASRARYSLLLCNGVTVLSHNSPRNCSRLYRTVQATKGKLSRFERSWSQTNWPRKLKMALISHKSKSKRRWATRKWSTGAKSSFFLPRSSTSWTLNSTASCKFW